MTISAINPDVTEGVETAPARSFVVVLYNDDHHDFDDVVLEVQKATGKTEGEAYQITLEAHESGKSVAYRSDLEECQRVASAMRRTGLQVEVDEA